MMTQDSLKITESKAVELDGIMEIPLENIVKFTNILDVGNGEEITTFSNLISKSREVISHYNSSIFIQNCLSLSNYSQVTKKTPQQTIESLNSGLKKYKWNEGKIKDWEKYSILIEKIIGSKSIAFISKIADLALTHENHVHEAKILTEMRPVFDEQKESIKAFVVYNDLIIRFNNGESEKALTLSLTYDDLSQLKKTVDAAIKKTETARNFGDRTLGTETVVYSDQIFGDDNQTGN
jgi:hypothetical protein